MCVWGGGGGGGGVFMNVCIYIYNFFFLQAIREVRHFMKCQNMSGISRSGEKL